eukprot:9365861-Pyramimonas_sp.AAC.1
MPQERMCIVMHALMSAHEARTCLPGEIDRSPGVGPAVTVMFICGSVSVSCPKAWSFSFRLSLPFESP